MNPDHKPPEKKKNQLDVESDPNTPVPRKKPRNASSEANKKTEEYENSNIISDQTGNVRTQLNINNVSADIAGHESDINNIKPIPARIDKSIVENEIIDQDVTRNADDMIEIDRCLQEYFRGNTNATNRDVKDFQTRDLRLAFSIHLEGKNENGTEINIEEYREIEDAFRPSEEEDDCNSETAASMEDANSNSPNYEEDEFESDISSDEEKVAPVTMRKKY